MGWSSGALPIKNDQKSEFNKTNINKIKIEKRKYEMKEGSKATPILF